MPLRHAIIPVTPFRQNASLVWNPATRAGVVVDPGGDLPLIRTAIARHGVVVEKILLTHGHLDHAGGAAELALALSVPVEGPHEADRFLLDGIPEQAARFGLAGLRAVSPDRVLAEGDVVSIGGESFAVWHCPGHSPGHVVFTNVAENLALVGDVLFAGSVGRTDFPYGDHAALIDAIRSKLFPLGDAMAFICGHGPGSTFGAERAQNPYCGDPR